MITATIFSAIAIAATPAAFTLEDDGEIVRIMEDGRPVLVYNYTMVEPPRGVDSDRYARASYIHPLYGVEGDVLTQDFPSDHYHHRGVYWTWPLIEVGDRPLDLWSVEDGHQVFEEWTKRELEDDSVTIAVQNGWRFRGEEESVVREDIEFVVHPVENGARSIDFTLTFTNICDDPVSILGAEGKGYGGFCFRPDANRKPMNFTTKDGPRKRGRDALQYDTPWADVSMDLPSEEGEESPGMSGVAIFQHPSNPEFPFDGWILRHYGFLGASWPHEKPFTMQPGESFTLRYRLYVHAGNAQAANVAQAWQHYLNEQKNQ